MYLIVVQNSQVCVCVCVCVCVFLFFTKAYSCKTRQLSPCSSTFLIILSIELITEEMDPMSQKFRQ